MASPTGRTFYHWRAIFHYRRPYDPEDARLAAEIIREVEEEQQKRGASG